MATREEAALRQCSDEQLIRCLQHGTGTIAALGEELAHRYLDRLYRSLGRSRFNPQEADEIVQEAFLAAFSTLDALEVDKTRVSVGSVLKLRSDAAESHCGRCPLSR